AFDDHPYPRRPGAVRGGADSGDSGLGVGVPGTDRNHPGAGSGPAGGRVGDGAGHAGRAGGPAGGAGGAVMNLFRAEWRRLFKRRITVGTLLGVVVVLGLVAGGIANSNQKIGPEALAEAEAAAQAEYEEQLRWHEETIDDQVAQCREEQAAAEAAGEPSPWGEGFDCEMLREWVPVREDFQAEWYLPPTFSFRDGFESMIGVFAAILALFGFLVGASFVGAEWRSGGMMNLLLWQPRRLRVLGTKLTTLLL